MPFGYDDDLALNSPPTNYNPKFKQGLKDGGPTIVTPPPPVNQQTPDNFIPGLPGGFEEGEVPQTRPNEVLRHRKMEPESLQPPASARKPIQTISVDDPTPGVTQTIQIKDTQEYMHDTLDSMFDHASKTPDLNWVESGFLAGLQMMEAAGHLFNHDETPLRLYNDVVNRGRKETITEKDFNKEDIDGFRKMIEAKISDTGKTTGKIDYPDYQKHGLKFLSQALGGFKYSQNEDGTIDITDMYDFNKDRAGKYDNDVAAQLLSMLFEPRNLAASIGRKVVPDDPGRGVPVKIKVK